PTRVVAMNEARACTERGLDAFAKDEPIGDITVTPEPDDASAHRPERLRLSAVDWSSPYAARRGRYCIGKARQNARRGAAIPQALRMPAQPTEVRHVLEHNAAAQEVRLTRSPCDLKALSPDSVG